MGEREGWGRRSGGEQGGAQLSEGEQEVNKSGSVHTFYVSL